MTELDDHRREDLLLHGESGPALPLYLKSAQSAQKCACKLSIWGLPCYDAEGLRLGCAPSCVRVPHPLSNGFRRWHSSSPSRDWRTNALPASVTKRPASVTKRPAPVNKPRKRGSASGGGVDALGPVGAGPGDGISPGQFVDYGGSSRAKQCVLLALDRPLTNGRSDPSASRNRARRFEMLRPAAPAQSGAQGAGLSSA